MAKSKKTGKTTLQDIADKLGVARSTVSYAINDRYVPGINITEDRREQIKKTALELGYRLDDMARAISTGKAKVIGFACPNPADSDYFAPMIASIMEAAAKHGFMIKLLFVKKGNTAELIDTCIDQRLSGVLLYTVPTRQLASIVRKLQENNIVPAVIGNSVAPDNCIHVVNDDQAGCRMMIRELYKLGHRKIAYIGKSFLASRIRQEGFLQAMTELNLEIKPAYIYRQQDIFKIKKHIAKLIKKDCPHAFFCNGDNTALTVICSIRDCGLRVPDDISVAGFGNLSCGLSAIPTISTVSESHHQVSIRIIDKIIAAIDNKNHGELHEKITPSIIVRQSTAKSQNKK